MRTSFLGKVHVMPSKYDPETRAKAAANANLRWFAGWSNRWKEALKESGKEPKENPTEQEVIAARMPQAVMGIPWMQPDEVAPSVVFLCTDAANRVSGATYDATAGDSVKITA